MQVSNRRASLSARPSAARARPATRGAGARRRATRAPPSASASAAPRWSRGTRAAPAPATSCTAAPRGSPATGPAGTRTPAGHYWSASSSELLVRYSTRLKNVATRPPRRTRERSRSAAVEPSKCLANLPSNASQNHKGDTLLLHRSENIRH